MVAHCNNRKETLNCTTCDVVGAFPRVARPPDSIRLYIRIPPKLPHPWAGGYLEILGAIYGLKESSRLFQIEMIKVLRSAGFNPTSQSPMTFIATDPENPNLKSIASLVVDDIRNLDNCPRLTLKLHEALQKRFSEITTTADARMFAGIEQDLLVLNGITSISEHQTKYILRTAKNLGVTHMPPILTLTMPDFYEPSSTAEDCLPADDDFFRKLVGHLIVLLKTRHEIRPFVSHLSRQTHPNAGDMSKAIYLLRYLFSTLDVRCVFSALDPIIYGYSDSAFAFHSDGSSSKAIMLCIGPSDAPFVCQAKAQSTVAPDIVAGEY
jgi:hypothetical protein